MRLRVSRLFGLVFIVAAVSIAYHYYETVVLKNNPYARFVQGSTNLRLGNLGEAERVWRELDRMVDLAPAQKIALQEKFKLLDYCRKLNEAKARKHVDQALALCRRVQPAIDEERITDKELAYLTQALSHLECAAMYGGADRRYSYLIAYTLLHLGKTEEAAPLIKAALKENPTSADTVVLQAIMLERSGQLDEAISACLGALQIKEDHPWANYYLARFLVKNEEVTDQSFQAAQKAAAFNKIWAKKLAALFSQWPDKREVIERLGVEAAIHQKKRAEQNRIIKNRVGAATVNSYGGAGRGGGVVSRSSSQTSGGKSSGSGSTGIHSNRYTLDSILDKK
jgi:tetratricopeptide (TPR) repeat protein